MASIPQIKVNIIGAGRSKLGLHLLRFVAFVFGINLRVRLTSKAK